jgi:hypothetical protein
VRMSSVTSSPRHLSFRRAPKRLSGNRERPDYSTLQTPKYEVRKGLSAQPREL